MLDKQQNINQSIFQQAKLFRYRLPFKIPVLFREVKLSAREGVILQVQKSNGEFYFAEIAPLPGFSKETLQQAVTQVIEILNKQLLGNKVKNTISAMALYPSVQFALDCIVHNIPISALSAMAENIPLLQGNNESVLKQYIYLNKPHRIKLKIARQSIAEDIKLFSALSTLNKNLLLRCDANQGWSFQQAALFFANINTRLIDYIEEPTASLSDNIALAERYRVYLALDESLQEAHFLYRHHQCFKALILKPTLIGSFARLNYFIAIAKEFHLSVSISSSFESPLGLMQLAFLARQWPKELDVSYGLDTLKFFESATLDKMSNKKLPVHRQIQQLECLWTSN